MDISVAAIIGSIFSIVFSGVVTFLLKQIWKKVDKVNVVESKTDRNTTEIKELHRKIMQSIMI